MLIAHQLSSLVNFQGRWLLMKFHWKHIFFMWFLPSLIKNCVQGQNSRVCVYGLPTQKDKWIIFYSYIKLSLPSIDSPFHLIINILMQNLQPGEQQSRPLLSTGPHSLKAITWACSYSAMWHFIPPTPFPGLAATSQHLNNMLKESQLAYSTLLPLNPQKNNQFN